MSTAPGDHAWRDAGLIDPDTGERSTDEPVNLVQEADEDAAGAAAGSGEDYHPHTPRPDRDGLADEADVADQAVVVPAEDPDEGEY
ncbi:hypothetical protein IM660_07375 [Ruania alkalisoli]|uniref:DUF5709 domain-containing protein n=1 Tax=Ruania alkalisoli TaxID=2779775 RepID=A0A7M1SWY0_9MICO|nr:hypothetical protein [Ruania alkalisoli]QOR72055.1 hypothetical protein IM660_07375 [Ruania alkalisoli]